MGSDPKKAFDYGFKQEKAFGEYIKTKVAEKEYQKWLKDKDKISLVEKSKKVWKAGTEKLGGITEKAKEIWKAGTKKIESVTEKVVGAAKTGAQFAKEGAEEALAGAKVVGEKIGVGTKETLTGWEKLGSEMGTNFAQATNIINTSINNSQRVTNTGSAGRGGYYSDYTRLVMRGDLDED